jgi:hypothetical protein
MELSSKVAVAGILIALAGVGAGFGLAALAHHQDDTRVEAPSATVLERRERGERPTDREALAMVTTRPIPEPPRPVLEARPSAPSPDAVRSPDRGGRSTEGLRVRRVVVATDVVDREPVGASERFDGDEERLFVFVDLANAGEATEVVVTFEPEVSSREAHVTGLVELDVPGGVRRHRTWAWSRNVHAPGRWSAVVRDLDGAELARAPFVVE